MRLKWIQCEVSQNHRDAFAVAQQAWRRLKTVDGFCGQIGGWDLKNPSLACVLGLWSNEYAYRRFMNDVHDGIFNTSGQQETYSKIDVLLAEVLIDIPGTRSHITAALADGQLLRVADCQLLPDRDDHFMVMQRSIWNPAMAATGGMLAGAFGQVADQTTSHYLACTLWQNETVHKRYVQSILPTLQRRAELDQDLRHISGYFVRLEPAWCVLPS